MYPSNPHPPLTDARWQWFQRWHAAQGGERLSERELSVEWQEFERFEASLTEERRVLEMEGK